MRLRRTMLLTHRWLGLGSSAVLAIMGLTGALILLFEDTLPFRGAVGAVHERLGLGRLGQAIALVVLIAAVLLQLSGLILWWKRKTLRVRLERGLPATLDDLHHVTGVVLLPVMLIMVLTALAMRLTLFPPDWSEWLTAWHTGGTGPLPIKALYFFGTLAFAYQGFSGIVMWARPLWWRRTRSLAT